MAELAAKGTYVKIVTHVWYDQKADNIHLTSSDKDLPSTKLHMTAKKGTQSDTNLRALLDNFGCGPKQVKEKTSMETLSAELAEIVTAVEEHADPSKLGPAFDNIKKMLVETKESTA